MKNVISVFLLFLSTIVFSQSIETLSQSPEIYVYFKPSKHQERIDQKDIHGQKNGEFYYFYFGKNKYSFMMLSKMFLLKQEVRIENKSFLKLNKEKIIDYNFMNQYSLETVLKIFGGQKKIYLINREESESGKVTLKEVRLTSSIPFDM